STDHVVAYRNQNLLLLSPLALALFWYGIRIVARGVVAVSALRRLAMALVISSLLALLLKVLPLEWQDNMTLLVFFLPCWFGLWVAAMAAYRFPVPPSAEQP
ncbi:MAG: hypothetical protein ACM3ZE_28215, partial [Myxococcales bacterium]